jgi:hypothetical protein
MSAGTVVLTLIGLILTFLFLYILERRKCYALENPEETPSEQRDGQKLRVRSNLTSSKKLKIKTLCGFKCEYCRYISRNALKKPIQHLEIHHIEEVATSLDEEIKEINSPNNLIVLCLEHHRDCTNGAIQKYVIQEIVKNRPNFIKDGLKSILSVE